MTQRKEQEASQLFVDYTRTVNMHNVAGVDGVEEGFDARAEVICGSTAVELAVFPIYMGVCRM